jgi:hypothetical protein
MRYLCIILLIFSVSTTLYSQPKTEFGVTTEGSWCMKNESRIPIRNYGERSNWGTGIGGYVSVPVWWRFSLSSGLSYRYSEYQKGIPEWKPVDFGGSILSGYTWYKSSRNYLVVPLNLRLLVTKKIEITGGIEACHLFGYNYLERDIEYNWAMGFGNKSKKLNWEIKLTSGLKEQAAEHQNTQGQGINDKWLMYKTKMIQLSLSYPLWKK